MASWRRARVRHKLVAAVTLVVQVGAATTFLHPLRAAAEGITQVQEAGAYTTTPAVSLTTNLNTSDGDLIVVTTAVSGALFDKVSPVADSSGSNTYRMIVEETNGSLTVGMFYSSGAVPITSVTVTATGTATIATSVQELTGVDTLDGIVGSDGLSSSPDTGPSYATSQPTELVVAGIGFVGPGTLTAHQSSYDFNSLRVTYPTPAPVAIQTAYALASTGGSQEYGRTFSSPNSWGAVAATFYSSSAAASPNAGASSTLSAGQQLRPGQYLTDGSSHYTNADFELIMQTDGNLVLYAPKPNAGGGYQPPGGGPLVGRPLWSSGTYGYSYAAVQNTFYAILQSDGNFVLYGNPCFPNPCSPRALWSSGTWGNSDYLVVQSDGNLVIYCNSGGGRQCSRGAQAIWSTGTFHARDTPAWTATGNGSCWTGPYFCRNTASRRANVYFRAIDEFSSSRPSYLQPTQRAVNAWNSAPGPQYYSFAPHANDTWVYVGVDMQHSPDIFGYAQNWRTDGSQCGCDNGGTVMWSDIFFVTQALDRNSGYIQTTAAHESGHAMLLNHNPNANGALMWPVAQPVNGPTDFDLGSYACNFGGYGIFCIYGWGS